MTTRGAAGSSESQGHSQIPYQEASGLEPRMLAPCPPTYCEAAESRAFPRETLAPRMPRYPTSAAEPWETASWLKPLRFFRKKNLSQKHDLFSGCK